MTMMPTAAKMQKERRVGRTVEPPMLNATKSVMEVMVMVVEVMVPVVPALMLVDVLLCQNPITDHVR